MWISCLPDLKVWRPPDFPALVFATKKLVTINDGFQFWYSFVFKQLPILSQYFFFLLPTSHLLFSTKSQRAKSVTQLFLFISISTIWNNRFSDFSCSLFSYYGKKCAFFGNTDLIFLGIVVVTQIEPEMKIW